MRPFIYVLISLSALLVLSSCSPSPVVTVSMGERPIPEELYQRAKTTPMIKYYRNDLSIFEHAGDPSIEQRLREFSKRLSTPSIEDVFDLGAFKLSDGRIEALDPKWNLVDWRIGSVQMVDDEILYFDYLSIEKLGEDLVERTGIMFWRKFSNEWYFVNFPFDLSGVSVIWSGGVRGPEIKDEIKSTRANQTSFTTSGAAATSA